MECTITPYKLETGLSSSSLYLSSSWAGLNAQTSPVHIARYGDDYWILVRKNLFSFSARFSWLPLGWFFSSLYAYSSPTNASGQFLRSGCDFARKLGCVNFIVCELSKPQDLDLLELLDLDNSFHKKTWGTFLVDMTKDEKSLLENVKKEARKLVNKAKREGVTVRIAESERDFQNYYLLLKSSREKLGFTTGPYQDVLNLRQNFGSDYTVFLAEYKGKLIAGMGILHKKGFMKEIGAGRDDEYKTLYANDLLKWEIILWGHSKGYKVYDLGGANPNPAPGSKEEGIYKFKEKWGGTFCEVYTYTKIVCKWKNSVLNILKRLAGSNI